MVLKTPCWLLTHRRGWEHLAVQHHGTHTGQEGASAAASLG